MSDLPQQTTIKQYTGDGVTVEFVTTFYVPLESDGTPDLDVYVTPEGQTPVPATDIQTYNVDWTYTPNADPITGGTVLFVVDSTPPDGSTVTLNRDVSASLDVEFADARNFSGAALDAALDKLLLIAQQNKTYALNRNLSYRVNALIPDANVEAYTQVEPLDEGYIWMGAAGGGVSAVLLTSNDNWSTLRSELENDSPVTNGAAMIGYYDTVNATPTTVADFLNNLTTFISSTLNIPPVGSMVDYAGSSVPTGWLLCDGSAVSRTTYAALFAAISTTWGVGDGSTTFNLPDFSRRVAVGSGGSGSATLGNAVGNTGGEETHVLTEAEMPAHTHSGSVPFANQVASRGGGGADTVTNASSYNFTTGSTGSGTAHNIIQPSAIVTKIIKY